LLGALKRPTPFELLEAIPGPESLRAAAAAADELGVAAGVIAQAHQAIDAFASLVREHYGTRAALTAALSGRSRTLRARIDQAGRFDVFNGMRRILGVEARTWLTTMIFVPSPTDEDIVAVTTLHGALGLRRLRSDTEVHFTMGPPYRDPQGEPILSLSPVQLHDLYTHTPARIESSVIAGQLRHRLVEDRLGKHAMMDMLAVSHDDAGSRRYAAPGAPLRGMSMFVDVPVRMLVCDALVHEGLFPGSGPELVVYNTAANGPANPNDPARGLDRVNVAETVARVPSGPDTFSVAEVPNYGKMIGRICRHLGVPGGVFRVYRLQMAYPVYCFQFNVVFRAPLPPES
jgi:hypothetical protein